MDNQSGQLVWCHHSGRLVWCQRCGWVSWMSGRRVWRGTKDRKYWLLLILESFWTQIFTASCAVIPIECVYRVIQMKGFCHAKTDRWIRKRGHFQNKAIFIQLQRKYVHFEWLNQVCARGELSVLCVTDKHYVKMFSVAMTYRLMCCIAKFGSWKCTYLDT